MNFFPGIYESKRVKKATSFSNPLTGALYSNRQFLKNCKNVPRAISDLDHIKQIKHDTHNQQNTIHDKKIPTKRQSLNKQQLKKMEREMIAIHATSRMAESTNKTFNDHGILKRRYNKAFEKDAMSEIQKISMNKTFTSGKVSKIQTEQLANYEKGSKNESKLDVRSVFQDIEILLLDLLDQKQDIRRKVIKINLQKYFRSFFKKQLLGHFTKQFLEKVQHYIQIMMEEKKLDQQIQQQLFPVEFFSITSRISFMNKLHEFESKKSHTNDENIRALIKFYCIPSKEFRQSCLRDIIMMLSLEVFEKFNCSRNQQYVLLDQNGLEITEILQINFSTRKLFLTSKKNAKANFLNYRNLLDQFYREGKKLTFTENIKINFRNKLAEGKYDESHFNYIQNYDIERLKRCVQLQNAEKILKKRIQTHRLHRFTPKLDSLAFNEKQNITYKEQSLDQQNKDPISQDTFKELPQTSKINDKSNFWKVSLHHRMASQNTQKTLPSPKKNKSPQLKSRSYSKLSSQSSKQKLKELLNQNKIGSLDAQTQKLFREEFRDLVIKNDIFDFAFNHYFKDRVMKDVLKKFFIYFKDKSDSQINKIFKAIKSMNVDGGQMNNNNSQIPTRKDQKDDQFDKNDKVKAQDKQNQLDESKRLKYLENSFSWWDFKNLRTTVACDQPKEVIMNFIAHYINFNEFGQLNKEQLFSQVQLILGDNCELSTVQVIADVIWSWFQKNSIIQNGVIRRLTLESWYQKYKIVYFLFISLIFGTNHKTILDLAYEVLA